MLVVNIYRAAASNYTSHDQSVIYMRLLSRKTSYEIEYFAVFHTYGKEYVVIYIMFMYISDVLKGISARQI